MQPVYEFEEVEGQIKSYLITGPGQRVPVLWGPMPGSQTDFLSTPGEIFECLFEGTRGPGKTDALLFDFVQHCGPRTEEENRTGRYVRGWGAEWKGILFRQTYPQLSDVISKTKKWFNQFPNPPKFHESKTTWTWPTGETLKLTYGMKESDYWNYHGHAYPWMAFEELTTWPDPAFYLKMHSCCRSTVPGIPRKIRATTNPYGPGHNWVKFRFGLPVSPGKRKKITVDKETGHKRAAVRGTLDENLILLKADPEYKERLISSARNKSELMAWVHGSWDIVAGGMFDDVWDADFNAIREFSIPGDWPIYRSFDYGSAKPFSVGWWAVSNGEDVWVETSEGQGYWRSTVPGDIFRIYEWYGWNGQPNEGMRMLVTDIAKGIAEREIMWNIHKRVIPGPADSSIFNLENGSSTALQMQAPIEIGDHHYANGVTWTRADKKPGSRMAGWELMRQYLKDAHKQEGKPREKPGLFIFGRCEQFIRTVPVLPRDLERNPDDVNTDAEDHIADEARYFVKSQKTIVSGGRVKGLTH